MLIFEKKHLPRDCIQIMRAILIITALLVAALPLLGQAPELVGIGLSGSEDAYDTTVVNGAQVYVVGACTIGPDTGFVGVHYSATLHNVLARYYDTIRPDTAGIGSNLLPVPPESIVYDDGYDPPRFWFAVTLPAGIDPGTVSLQLQFGVVAMASGTGDLVYGTMKTSHAATHGYEPCLNPVDELHETFLRVEFDQETDPPILLLPESNTADNASFTLQFTLREVPLLGSVRARITDEDPSGQARRHLIFGALVAPGTYTIVLNGEDLPGSSHVTDMEYEPDDTTYYHFLEGHSYELKVGYRDAAGNDSAMSNVADSVLYDISTVPPTVNYPNSGMTFGSGGLTVSYMLEERPLAGSLRLGLRQTAGEMTDPDSPHLFYPSYDSPGWYEILLRSLDLQASDGLDSLDAGPTLIPNSVYELTVEYQDTMENPVASVVISGLTYVTGATIYARGEMPPGAGFVVPQQENAVLFRLSLRASGGIGLFRGVNFEVTGNATSADFVPNSITLWLSQDSVFNAAADVPLATLPDWTAPISFSEFHTPIDTIERHYFLSASFDSLGNSSHTFSINVTDATQLDCGSDAVTATNWPLVTADVGVDVTVTSFEARTDSSFGTLLLVWHVASEHDNDGFNIWRSEAPDTGFVRIAHYLEDPSLEGIGDHVWGYWYSWLDRDVEIGRTYYYRLESVSFSGLHDFYEEVAFGTPLAPPSDYILRQNHPNPFNAMTTIEYLVPRSSRVWLTVYDILGRKVSTLADGQVHSPAVYRVNWHGRDDSGQPVASGIYFYQLRGERGFRTSRKMVFLQ